MNVSSSSQEPPVNAIFLKKAVKHAIFGEVEYVTGSQAGWTVYLRDPNDLPACTMQSWAGRPVRYTVLPPANF